MLIHQRHTDFQFGNEVNLESIEEHVHKHFVECYALIEMFKERDEKEKVINRL